MKSQTRAIGVLSALLLCGASNASAFPTGESHRLLQHAVQIGDESGLLINVAAARGGGAQRQASGNRGGGGGAHQVRSSANSNVNHNRSTNANANRNINANRNVNANQNINANVNRNVNVNRDVNVDVDRNYYGDWDDRWHPVATAAAVATTAAIVGSIVTSIPPSCSTVVVNGIGYSQCGSTWYQPQYAGTSVQYVVVNPPQ
jgi:hypothetical protein